MNNIPLEYQKIVAIIFTADYSVFARFGAVPLGHTNCFTFFNSGVQW